MDILLRAGHAELTPDLGTTLAGELEHSLASVRPLQSRVPGVASEPLTTAILVAVAGQSVGVLAQQLFGAIANWVKRHHSPVSVEIPQAPKQPSAEMTVVITPENLADPAVRARVLALLTLTEA